MCVYLNICLMGKKIMTIYHGISLILLAVIILVIGLFKPKWILFWIEYPSRLMITGISIVIFMVGAVLFGEGNKQKQLELKKEAAIVKSGKIAVDIPEPEKLKPIIPVPAPAQAATTSANDLRP